MATLDIFILSVIAIGIIVGAVKGGIKQLSSLLGFIVGFLAAAALYDALAEKICPVLTESMTVAQIIAFVMIWIAVPLLFTILASVLTKAMEAISLGWLNRFIGGIFGGLKYLLFLVLIFALLDYFDSDEKVLSKKAKKESYIYEPMQKVSIRIIPFVKEKTEQYILKDGERKTI